MAEQASEFIDRQPLPRFQRQGMKLHLMMCKNCRVFYQQFELMTKALSLRPLPTQIQKSDIQRWLKAVEHEQQRQNLLK